MAPPTVNVGAWVTFLTLVIGALVTISLVGVRAYFTVRTEADKQHATYVASHLSMAQQVSYMQGKQDVLQDYTKSQNRQIAQVRDQTQALALVANASAATTQAQASALSPVGVTLPVPGTSVQPPPQATFATGTIMSPDPQPGGTNTVGEPPFEQEDCD